jgi:hypothetical protein
MKIITTQAKYRTREYKGRLTMKVLIVLTLFISISGCSTSLESDPVELSFGNSVRRMVEAQSHQPVLSAGQASYQSPEGLTGKLSEQIFKTYREGVSKPESVKMDESLDIDLQ